MEYSKNSSKSSEWQGDNYYEPQDSNLDPAISECAWDGVARNGEDYSYMFEVATPIKACGDFSYDVNDCGNMNKISLECRENSSLVKRRRMLEFTDEIIDPSFSREDTSSTFLRSKERIDALDEILSQLETNFKDDTSPLSLEALDESDSWLADCLVDNNMHVNSDDGNISGMSDVQINIAECCNAPFDTVPNVVQKRPVRSSKNVIFKGKKSYMRPPPKLASSVAYPFTFIKPCGIHGDVTLKDINQRIQGPPLSISKQKEDDQSVCYPTSAFSGKPVVGKTKIRTEGGKGSITIMRTKG